MAAGYFEYSPMLFEAPGLGWPGPGDAQARRSGPVRFPPRRRSGNGLLWTFHGTSQASPTAAGIAALLLQVDGTQTPARIAAVLKASGAKVTDPNNSWQFTEIDALNAVDLARQVTAGVTVNQSTFSVGQTLNVILGLANPGRPEAADVYLGLFRPDSSIQFITDTGIVLGNVHRPLLVSTGRGGRTAGDALCSHRAELLFLHVAGERAARRVRVLPPRARRRPKAAREA
jgi:subtilisin family serine protease